MSIRTLRLLLLSMTALVLTGCGSGFLGRTVPTLDIGEDYTTDIRASEYTLAPGENFVTWFDLSTARSEAIYFVASAGDLRLRTPGSTTFASSSTGFYFASGEAGIEPVSSTATSQLAPADVGVTTSCSGPCIIIDTGQAAAIGTGYVRLSNPFTTELDVQLWVFSKEFDDAGEPGNDTSASATTLSAGTDSGALEVLGNQDYFVLTEGGNVTVDAPSVPSGGRSTDPLAIEVEVLQSDGTTPIDPSFVGGSNPVVLDPGEFHTFTGLFADEYVRIRAFDPRGASAEYSKYFVELAP